MVRKKSKKRATDVMPASLRKEMAGPRMARSAKIAELNLDTARIRERPSSTLPGIVDKIIASPRPGQPEKAQIAVAGAKRPHRNLRIENTLTDEHGDDVKLTKGAHVDVTVTDDSHTSTTK
jgi:hypothetical protein